jgi:hypothetical protein
MRADVCYIFLLPDLRIVSIRPSAGDMSWGLYLDDLEIEIGYKQPQDAATAAQLQDFSQEAAIHAFSGVRVSDDLKMWHKCDSGELWGRIEQRGRAKATRRSPESSRAANDETAFAD